MTGAHPAGTLCRTLFETLKTGIDGLDAVLGGGVRYPAETAAFVLITGGPGSGKTLLALEMLARAWLTGPDGTTYLYYSVEQSPDDLHKKIAADFDHYGLQVDVETLPREVPNKLCLQAKTANGTTRLVITHANPASLDPESRAGATVDIEWILAEIGNYRLASGVGMVCIDNVGLLLTDLDYFAKRTRLVATRHMLMSRRIHGIFVQEESSPRDLRTPSAEEFSTDLLIRLSFLDRLYGFKARSLEILKARHQYYYRGSHHFSIAGRDMRRDGYLGARNERGPGIHLYPSVAAQLSIARDNATEPPRRGQTPIDFGQPDFRAPFLNGTGPVEGSSTVLLAEPGTRYTYLALRFLAAGLAGGRPGLMVSTKEDPDTLTRICQRETALAPHCLRGDDELQPDLRVMYLHPEYVSPGKLIWDVVGRVRGEGRPAARLAFDNAFRLADRFPLLDNQTFLISALLDLLRYQGVTSLFVDLVPPGSARGRADFNPAQYMTTFDNVFHLYLERQEGEDQRPYLRVLKSSANDFKQTQFPIDYRRV